MSYLFVIVMGLLMGWLTSYLAKKRGREAVEWFLIGMAFGLLGLLILYLLPVLPPKENKELPLAPSVEAASSKEIPLSAREKRMTLSEAGRREWYYLDQNKHQVGPLSFDALKKLWIDRKVGPLTYIWTDSLPDWRRISEMEDFERYFENEASASTGF